MRRTVEIIVVLLVLAAGYGIFRIHQPPLRSLHGFYIGKPLHAKGLPQRFKRFSDSVEYLYFLDGTYVLHGVLHKKSDQYVMSHLPCVYYYHCRKDSLWIFLGPRKELQLLETGKLSGENRVIKLFSQDPAAKAGPFALKRCLVKDNQKWQKERQLIESYISRMHPISEKSPFDPLPN